jgi:membrane-bound inhibitor of C-type lysozyme
MNKRLILSLALIIVVVGGLWLWWSARAKPGAATSGPVATVTFACDAGKSLTASFFNGAAAASTNPSQPPMPTGHVELSLSDGRTMSLPQTISADGARYSNGNPQVTGSETFVFWEKGNGAFIEEGANQTQTYTGCVAEAPDPGGLPQVYSDGTAGYSFRYPTAFALDTSYQYQELGPGKVINGVKVTIPADFASGTNLSPDSYLSVEQLPNVQDCEASLFLDGGAGVSTSTITDGDTTYSIASSTGAGAGNRYEEIVYALPGSNPCTAVRYFIHYGVLDNYPAGTVGAFDEAGLLAQFDKIRRTLTLAQ